MIRTTGTGASGCPSSSEFRESMNRDMSSASVPMQFLMAAAGSSIPGWTPYITTWSRAESTTHFLPWKIFLILRSIPAHVPPPLFVADDLDPHGPLPGPHLVEVHEVDHPELPQLQLPVDQGDGL